MVNLTPAELAAIAPQPHPLEIEARKLIAWCERPWLSEVDRARYLGWAEEYRLKVAYDETLAKVRSSLSVDEAQCAIDAWYQRGLERMGLSLDNTGAGIG